MISFHILLRQKLYQTHHVCKETDIMRQKFATYEFWDLFKVKLRVIFIGISMEISR